MVLNEPIDIEKKVPKGYVLAKKTQNDNWAIAHLEYQNCEIDYVSGDLKYLYREYEDELEFVDSWEQDWQIIPSDFYKQIKKKHISFKISLEYCLKEGYCKNGILSFLRSHAPYLEGRVIECFENPNSKKNILFSKRMIEFQISEDDYQTNEKLNVGQDFEIIYL